MHLYKVLNWQYIVVVQNSKKHCVIEWKILFIALVTQHSVFLPQGNQGSVLFKKKKFQRNLCTYKYFQDTCAHMVAYHIYYYVPCSSWFFLVLIFIKVIYSCEKVIALKGSVFFSHEEAIPSFSFPHFPFPRKPLSSLSWLILHCLPEIIALMSVLGIILLHMIRFS